MREQIINPQLKLSPRKWLDEFAWWGMRYCIGRRSAASLMWSEIMEVLVNQKECFVGMEDRLRFFARDIRSEISQRMGWLEGITVSREYNSVIVTDAYSLLVRHLQNHPEEKFETHDFEIDCVAETVTSAPSKQLKTMLHDIFPATDFHGWIKLANFIDRQKKLLVGNGTQEEEVICVEMPTVEDYAEKKVAMVWSPILPVSIACRYYLPEYIKKIEDI